MPQAPAEIPKSLNGITFKDTVGADDLGCPNGVQPATPEQRAESPLDFIAGYLPPGFRMQFTVADGCGGRVTSLATRYVAAGGDINIARWTMRATRRPEVVPEAVQVAGKPAVRIGSGHLILVEPWGITSIEVSGLSYEETVKIAEGLRPVTPEDREREAQAALRPRVTSFMIDSGGAARDVPGHPWTWESPWQFPSSRVTLKAQAQSAEAVRFVFRTMASPAETIATVMPDANGWAEAAWEMPKPGVTYIVWAEAVRRPVAPVTPTDLVDRDGNWVGPSQPAQIVYVTN